MSRLLLILAGLVLIYVVWRQTARRGKPVAALPPVARDRDAALAGLASLNDPVAAAAVIMAAIACEDEAMSPERDIAYRALLAAIADPANLDAAADYGRQAASLIDDPQMVIDKVAPVLAAQLDDQEKEELLHMAQEAAMSGGKLPAALTQRLMRLRQKLGLEIS